MKELLILLFLSSFCFGQASKSSRNTVDKWVTIQELRSGKAGNSNVIYVNDGLRSGLFKRNDNDHKSLDDSSLIIRSGDIRYERIYTEILPEYFGANPNDTLDDGRAIQKALNKASKKGLKVTFSEGTYYTDITLVPKIVIPAPVYGYKLTLEGAGAGVTKIIAKNNITILQLTEGQTEFIGRESDILIRDIHFDGNTVAPYCIKANHIAGLKLLDCRFSGATLSNLLIGTDNSENYGIDIIRCYSLGNAPNDSHNNSGMELHNVRYAYIDRFTTDGSKYGIFMEGCDKSFITNCHLEGSKTASIYIGKGGGEHKISNNMFMPYVLYETSAKFDSVIEAVHIEGAQGSGAANIVYGNICIVPNPNSLPIKSFVEKPSASLRAHPTFTITGKSSKAKGKLIGYNTESKKILIQVVSGTFKTGETFSQDVTNATGIIKDITLPRSIGISVSGSSNGNIISNNQIRLNPLIGIFDEGTNSIISNNNIEAVTAIYKNAKFSTIIGNRLNSPGNTALKNNIGGIEAFGNTYIGSIIGISNGETKSSNINQKQTEISQSDFSGSLIRNQKELFKLSNNGDSSVHLVSLNNATLWLGNDSNSNNSKNLGITPKGQILLPNLPTSPRNLPSGALWMDPKENNVLKCVP